MRVRQRRWKINDIVASQETINLNPSWQRAPAWKQERQVLLIDSILRGMDIPKIYFRNLGEDGNFKFDAVDGQQRLRSIFLFRSGQLPLTHPQTLSPISDHEIAGKYYSELDKRLRKRFDNFEVSVAEITSATVDEISSLFSRLQMGVPLNPAELRNALGGAMRHVIDALATSHEFFLDGRIPDSRYKRQDFVTHAFAMAAYQCDRDIKAPDLREMVLDYARDRDSEVLELSAEVGDALTVLAGVNQRLSRRITQKWIFVDLCWLIMQRHSAGAQVDAAKLADAYTIFDGRRREYNRNPDTLIRRRGAVQALDRHLYQYINAFRLQAGTAAHLSIRNAALRAFCPNIDGRL